jgi:hypothetical protein
MWSPMKYVKPRESVAERTPSGDFRETSQSTASLVLLNGSAIFPVPKTFAT